jgi:hypothetical protein
MAANKGMKASIIFLLAGWVAFLSSDVASADRYHVWEPIEITLEAEREYENPYTEVEVWVDLTGPGFEKRCYGFWDGGRTFRVRVLANEPGDWRYLSGSNQQDLGLNGQAGKFEAADWTDAEKESNPNRRGMVRATSNGHALEYADGTPFFLLGDTWWAVPSFRFQWHDDDRPREIGPAAGFKDYVQYRRRQGFNSIAMIAALPHWANDGLSYKIDMDDGTVVRRAWGQAGTRSAKDMHDEDGNRPFLFPGKVPGFENVFPNVDRIVPAYFRNFDRKIDYLNAHGFVPFIEVARRDVGQVWKKYYDWPDSYVRFIQYIFARYQSHVCLLSPIHFDTGADSIPSHEWSLAARRVVERYGPPPFGTLLGTNANPSSLHNFGHVDKAPWLTFHQIGNRRTHDQYALLTEIYRTNPPVPGLHGEPYYDGMADAKGGSDLAALYCRSGLYGSVLSGAFSGHIYGAGGWGGGLWSGEVEAASKTPIWDVVRWSSADQMRHVKTFLGTTDGRYRQLEPATELVTPNKSSAGQGYVGWAYCARLPDRGLFLLYFEKSSPRARLVGLLPNQVYHCRWFNPRSGQWLNAGGGTVAANSRGEIEVPAFPSGKPKTQNDWAMRLELLHD